MVAKTHRTALVMPFVLTNAPSMFQSPMNDIFITVLILVIFDDILIYSRNRDDHLLHLHMFLTLLLNTKCLLTVINAFWTVTNQLSLGHLINKEGITTNP